MKKKFLSVLAALFVFSSSIQAQENDSLMLMNRKHHHEIGVDVKGLFNGGLGSALIYKKRDTKERLVSLVSVRNHRFQLSFSGNIKAQQKFKSLQNDSLNELLKNYFKERHNFSINVMYGKEKVKFYNKFSFYYGMDAGISYQYDNSPSNYYSSWINYHYQGFDYFERRAYGVVLQPFAGGKLRLSENFSFSLETSFSISYLYNKTSLYSNWIKFDNTLNSIKLADKYFGQFLFAMQNMRFLTLNYHFK